MYPFKKAISSHMVQLVLLAMVISVASLFLPWCMRNDYTTMTQVSFVDWALSVHGKITPLLLEPFIMSVANVLCMFTIFPKFAMVGLVLNLLMGVMNLMMPGIQLQYGFYIYLIANLIAVVCTLLIPSRQEPDDDVGKKVK